MPVATCHPAANCGGYRPRESFQSPLWRIVCDHLDTFVRGYDERHQAAHGPLPRHVEGVLNRFLRCGDPNEGVTLFRCAPCRRTVAVPYSCKTRICPSCMARRAEDLSHYLAGPEGVLPRVPYRHLTITLPRKFGFRKAVARDPDLLRAIVRLATGVLLRALARQHRRHRHHPQRGARAVPGLLCATQTFGDRLNAHPHVHALCSDGLFLEDGSFYPYLRWDAQALTAAFRESVVASFVRQGLLSANSAHVVRSLPVERCGFHVHVGSVVEPEERERLATLVRYLVRAPLALRNLTYDEATGQVRLRTRKGVEATWEHPVHLLASLAHHVPYPRRATVTYAGWFANSTGHLGPSSKKAPPAETPAFPSRAVRKSRWNQLVLRTWQVDPQICDGCGQPMKRSKTLYERKELVRLLDFLGLSGFPARPPPAPVPEPPPAPARGAGPVRCPPDPGLFNGEPGEPDPRPEHDDLCQVPPGWEDWDQSQANPTEA